MTQMVAKHITNNTKIPISFSFNYTLFSNDIGILKAPLAFFFSLGWRKEQQPAYTQRLQDFKK
jgi:hypothetical protein